MKRLASSFVLGYHGCDQAVALDVVNLRRPLKSSSNAFDWLGSGVYFWEANPKRGLDWAQSLAAEPKPKVKTPQVIGAVIDLGLCLDLTSSDAISWLKVAYEALVKTASAAGTSLPTNTGAGLRRELDCSVVNTLHQIRQTASLEKIQTVRAPFIEGSRMYAGSEFFDKTHIQIAVCDPSCIKGVFLVPPSQLK